MSWLTVSILVYSHSLEPVSEQDCERQALPLLVGTWRWLRGLQAPSKANFSQAGSMAWLRSVILVDVVVGATARSTTKTLVKL